MRGLLAVALALVLAAPATAASVRVAVVGRDGELVSGPARAKMKERKMRVGGRRCAVGARTPLSALAALDVRVRLQDYGSCSRRPRDASGLYVRSIAGTRAKVIGSNGWVYKVGHRLGTAGAGDPAGPFGRGGLKAGARVLWFWCTPDAEGRCPRTLDTSAERSGESVRVTVRGYDDRGRGVPVPGATVRLGDATATTGADGSVVLSGSGALTATRAGFVPALPRRVR